MEEQRKKQLEEALLLYAVTDRHWLGARTLEEVVKMSLEGGATFLQLREKQLEEGAFFEEALQLQKMAKAYGVPFVINDNVEIACRMDADGVHVGQSDMGAKDVRSLIGPEKILGVSAQTVEQAVMAQQQGADYLGVGAVFPTGSKADAEEVSYETLKAICEAVSIPVVAIGGITIDNTPKLAGSGICGVAVISAIYGQKDIPAATVALKKVVSHTVHSKTPGGIQNRFYRVFFPEDQDGTKAADWGHHLLSRYKSECFIKKEDRMKKALTIAGSDSGGGAGIQADIKTMTMNGVFAMSAITALTAQNTEGVTGILNVPPEFLRQQMDAVFEDIFPDAVKIGMVSSADLIEVIADRLQHYKANNIVVDPVMVATSGARLIEEGAVAALKRRLLPLAKVITPNIPEAELLCDMTIQTPSHMEKAAALLYETYGCAALVKGGHNINDANDVLYAGKEEGPIWFYGERIDNPNTHGTGCTLSSAIASFLAKGDTLPEAVKKAKAYLSGALGAMLDLGKGSGPLAHNYKLSEEA